MALDVTPSLASVGARIRSRTRDADGNLLGTFTPDTAPTDVEATDAINSAMRQIRPIVGAIPDEDADNAWPDELVDAARAAAELRSAMVIETGYFSEQVASGQSIYAELKEEYAEAKADLIAGLKRWQDGDAPGPGDNTGDSNESLAIGTFGGGCASDCDPALTTAYYDPTTKRYRSSAPAPNGMPGYYGYWITNDDGTRQWVPR